MLRDRRGQLRRLTAGEGVELDFRECSVRKKIGECLVQAGIISEDDLKIALAEQERTGERLGILLVRVNLATENQIAKALAGQLGFPYVNLGENPPDPTAAVLIPKDVSLKRGCMAIEIDKNVMTVAMSDPLLFSLVQDLELQTGLRIKQVVATGADIIEAIRIGYPDNALATSQAASDLTVTASSGRAPGPGDASGEETALAGRTGEGVFELVVDLEGRRNAEQIIDLVNLVVHGAIKSKASDIHVEPMENNVLIRHRLDGLLKEVMDLPKGVHDALIARIKSMAGMDIAETRLPQDGRLRVSSDDGTEIDFRVSTLRTLFGEKIVMRVLDHRKGGLALEEIGMSAMALEEMRLFLRHRHGMLLVVGPTGSGKTTTLSSALRAVQSERTNITTIEDPIEYQIPGVNQTQINEQIKLTFARALESILRQDPDVIMLGEIRDLETATLALQAAQTSHLILSALHSDDAASSLTRLMDIGAEPHLIASALVGVVAQRLVRRVCIHCRRQYTPTADTLRRLSISETDAAAVPFYKSIGCDQCNHTGYRGRVGIYEVMQITEKLRRRIASRLPEDQIREAALAGGMISLREEGVSKVKAGITTDEELLRVVAEVRDVRTLCAACGRAVGVDFVACPNCGKRLNAGCPHCGRSLQAGWQYCPYCARGTEMPPASKHRRDRDSREPARDLPPANIVDFKK